MSEAKDTAPELGPLDLAEKGRRGGQEISLDRRLFMKFTAFGRCGDPHAAIKALAEDGVKGALYVDANDPQGIGVMVAAEDPDYFVTSLRSLFYHRPFADYVHKAEFDMLGRSYSIGYEADLEDTLITKPLQKLLNPEHRWAVWYPLQRAKKFQTLPADHQRRILAEHGTLAKRYGIGGHAADIRLACHGLDKNDNDFVVGLVGPNLHPLSAVVQEMRKTEQTAQYLDSLGPFFVGKAVWQAPL
jgi:chlorite dismutase